MDRLRKAIYLIRKERARQIEEKGFDAEHDDRTTDHEELILAAATYEMNPIDRGHNPISWPWDIETLKHTYQNGLGGRIRELCKAGALYMAAKDMIERKGLETPLKQAVCGRIDDIAEEISKLLGEIEKQKKVELWKH